MKKFSDIRPSKNSKLIKVEPKYVQIMCFSVPPDSLELFEENVLLTPSPTSSTFFQGPYSSFMTLGDPLLLDDAHSRGLIFKTFRNN